MERLVLFTAAAAALLTSHAVEGKLADRSRIVNARGAGGSGSKSNGRPIEGPKYRNTLWSSAQESLYDRAAAEKQQRMLDLDVDMSGGMIGTEGQDGGRELGQLTGCCSTHKGSYSADMCGYYGSDCEEGGDGGNNKSGDEDCSSEGLSFIGISFSVNTASGNPYSYQTCDQFPMENIIDRDYNYVMSMDEDGWLVGGGYKTFDYSGKMPYIDSSHTELLRIGNLDPDAG